MRVEQAELLVNGYWFERNEGFEVGPAVVRSGGTVARRRWANRIVGFRFLRSDCVKCMIFVGWVEVRNPTLQQPTKNHTFRLDTIYGVESNETFTLKKLPP